MSTSFHGPQNLVPPGSAGENVVTTTATIRIEPILGKTNPPPSSASFHGSRCSLRMACALVAGRLRSRQTFAPADRIRKRREFQKVYERARKISSRSFTLFVLENEFHRPRLGITVTRRVGGAVQRNRAKRLVREWFRKAKRELPDLDLVVNPREGFHRADLPDISRELDERLRRALLRKGTS